MAATGSEMVEFHWLMDMLETIEVGLVVIDADYRVRVWNGFMEDHSGVAASRIKEKICLSVFLLCVNDGSSARWSR